MTTQILFPPQWWSRVSFRYSTSCHSDECSILHFVNWIHEMGVMSWFTAEPCSWLDCYLYEVRNLFPRSTSWFLLHQQHKRAVFIFWRFLPHLCSMGGSGKAQSFFKDNDMPLYVSQNLNSLATPSFSVMELKINPTPVNIASIGKESRKIMRHIVQNFQNCHV